jgi:hypothetical protein
MYTSFASAGPIQQLLQQDHDRLDALLARALSPEGALDAQAYEAFRKQLLRHIGIEEKLLFPVARRVGIAAQTLERLRADHGRLTALLVPSPTPELVAELRAILAPHNATEEGDGGIYAICEALAGADALELLRRIREAPEVKTRPHQNRIRPKRLG